MDVTSGVIISMIQTTGFAFPLAVEKLQVANQWSVCRDDHLRAFRNDFLHLSHHATAISNGSDH